MTATLKELLPDTRQRILEYLKQEGPLTAEALGKLLNITSMGARQQLHAMERDGLVEHKTKQQAMGRPGYHYGLTSTGDELFPRTYPQMANSLLETVRMLDGEKGIERLFKKRTDTLVAQYRQRMANKTLEEQVIELAAIRSEEGYMADWQKINKNAFRLREKNCAICQIASNYTQACHFELELFRKVLPNTEITRETHIIQGDRNCTYLIRKK
ncbi:MAG TPA: metalloregulator ArsR/SmtB family transcription factor [Acidobacteriota bacterium]|nr:metalloregulator ArsR/SmtB family transcription factor [Acidobacteriota bacterium]